MQGYHRSVLLREAVEALEIKSGKWYLDCTLGDGGHSIEIIGRGGKIVGVDVDPQVLKRARKRFQDEGISEDRFKLITGNFRDLKNLILRLPPVAQDKYSQTDIAERNFAGAIFDLGVSSLQLESPERGFSFASSGPLDMRMDPSLQVRALDLLNTLSRKELYELFKNLGEEKYSRCLADTLVSAREVSPITNTLELAAIVERIVGGRREKLHPATRVFQALRIAVNDELGALEEGLTQVIDLMDKNGRIVVISFHSLEDRIVKNTFKMWELAGIGQVLNKKPIMPGDEEIAENPRSRSAKMRVFEKI